jgi:tetratricopeptide (TPR) repeat protein
MLRMQAGRLCATAVFLLILVSSCNVPRIIILDDPLTPEEHINLGVAYERKDEWDNALKEYEAAAGKLPVGYLYLGNIYFQQGAYDKAESAYMRVINELPHLADAYNNLAWLYYTKGEKLSEAEELATKAIEKDPANSNYQDTLKKIRELLKKNVYNKN